MGRYREFDYNQRNDAYQEYVSILNDFNRHKNPSILGGKLSYWNKKWGLHKQNVYRHQIKILKGLY